MNYFWIMVISILILVFFMIGNDYRKAKNILGSGAAKNFLFRTLVSLAIATVTIAILLFQFHDEKMGKALLSIFFILSSLFFSVIAYVGIFHRLDAGVFLLDMGSRYGKKGIQIGMAWIVLMTFQVLMLVTIPSKGSSYFTDNVLEAVRFISMFSLSIYFITSSLSRLELREKGICIYFRFIAWERITSYYWTNWPKSKQDILILQLTPKYRFQPKFMSVESIEIPKEYRDTANQILNQQLPNKQTSKPSNISSLN